MLVAPPGPKLSPSVAYPGKSPCRVGILQIKSLWPVGSSCGRSRRYGLSRWQSPASIAQPPVVRGFWKGRRVRVHGLCHSPNQDIYPNRGFRLCGGRPCACWCPSPSPRLPCPRSTRFRSTVLFLGLMTVKLGAGRFASSQANAPYSRSMSKNSRTARALEAVPSAPAGPLRRLDGEPVGGQRCGCVAPGVGVVIRWRDRNVLHNSCIRY